MFTDTHVPIEKILETLSDKEWHSVHEFYPLAEHIAPEIACRAYLRAVPQRSKETRLNAEPHIKVKYGRRRMIDERVRHLKRTGIIEVRGKGVEKELRLLNGKTQEEPIMVSTPHEKFLENEDRCFGGLSEHLYDKVDEASLQKVVDILTANGFDVEYFPDFCRLDLSATRKGQKDDQGVSFIEYTALEVKQANFRLRSTMDSEGAVKILGVEHMRCKGAFIPQQKIDAFGCAASSGYHHQIFVYLFYDFEEPFFIPSRHLDLQTTEHPLQPDLARSDPARLRLEGQRSMHADLVERWLGIEPAKRHMQQINTKGYCECLRSMYLS